MAGGDVGARVGAREDVRIFGTSDIERGLGAGRDVHGVSWIMREGPEHRTAKVEGNAYTNV